VKNFENRSTFAEVMDNLVPGCFFMKHGYTGTETQTEKTPFNSI